MKKFISLVLALVMALSLTTIAWGAETVVNATSDAEIANALATTTTAELVINLPATTGSEVFTIELYANYNAAIKSVTINGTDKTKVKFANAQVRLVDFDEFTITDCEILHMATKSWGHLVFGGSKAGGVYTISDCLFTGVGTQGIYFNPVSDAEWNVVGCTFTGDFGTEGAVVLQNNSKPTELTVTDNDFAVTNGEELAIMYHKENLTLAADADVDDVVLITDTNGKTTAENFATAVANADAGDTFKLMANVDVTGAVIDKPITINENGNTLTGLTAGAGVTTDASGKVNGGTFASAPANVASGYEAVYTNGAYMVVPKTSAAGATTTLKDADKYDIYAVAGTTSVKAAKADITKKVTSNVSVTADGKTTTTYTATTYSDGTNVYVEVDASIATYKLMQGNTIVAYMVNLADVGYVPTTTKVATAFVEAKKAADQVCGDNTVDGYVIDGKTYVAGGANWAVLNGKFVSYTDTVVAKVPHTYADATYSAKDKSVTSVKCTACKVTWNVLTAKQVAVMAPASYTTATTASGTYFIPAAVVSAGATDTKVESAQTFDAGIAMYVGMSIMAAAGSAVVLKKKD